jgi:hypothetical protein
MKCDVCATRALLIKSRGVVQKAHNSALPAVAPCDVRKRKTHGHNTGGRGY